MIGVVSPQDYTVLKGGLSERVKADLAALLGGGYEVEVTYPSRRDPSRCGRPAGLASVTYPSMSSLRFLPEKAWLLVDMCTQTINPFFRRALRKRSERYSMILAHLPWSVIASHRAAGARTPILYVAHNFEYGVVMQTTRNPLTRKLVRSVEKNACRKAARTLCVSEQDMTAFESVYGVPRARLALLPNTVDVDSLSRVHDMYDRATERGKLGVHPSSLLLLFPGRMDYAPNVDALRFVVGELAPALREDGGDVKIIVAGSQIPKWCLKNGDETISFHSDVPDMRRFLCVADAVVVPLRIGGGTRLKILESFAARVPVISTRKGAEGIDCEDGQHLLMAQDSAHDFIDKAKLLAADAGLRSRLVANAHRLVSQRYSIPIAGRYLAEVISQVQAQAESPKPWGG
jgi:glycosyltransferase involved in cell wall biosynthesis